MRRIFTVLAALAITSFGSMVFAAEGDAPVVKGNIEIYGQAKVSYDMIDTGGEDPGR